MSAELDEDDITSAILGECLGMMTADS